RRGRKCVRRAAAGGGAAEEAGRKGTAVSATVCGGDSGEERAMRRALIAAALCIAAPVASSVQGRGAQAPPATAVARQPAAATLAAGTGGPRAVLDRYCVTCHNQRLKTAGLMLDTLDPARIGERAEVWEKVGRKIRTGAMPPAGRPRPDKALADSVAASLEESLDRVAAEHPDPGRPTLHRLNRIEYANAIRDLLALEIDAASLLPADNAAYGFDNNADALSL